MLAPASLVPRISQNSNPAGRHGPVSFDRLPAERGQGGGAFYSVRSACITSTRAARAAGITDAVTAASSSTKAEPATGSTPGVFRSPRKVPAGRTPLLWIGKDVVQLAQLDAALDLRPVIQCEKIAMLLAKIVLQVGRRWPGTLSGALFHQFQRTRARYLPARLARFTAGPDLSRQLNDTPFHLASQSGGQRTSPGEGHA